MEPLDTFLAKYVPFSAFDAATIAELAGGASERRFPAGTLIFFEDGPPSEGWYVLREGAIELLHDGQAIETLEPGESFGHPSLLTGLSPAFSVRAREDCVCALLAPEAARRALGSVAGSAFVAASMRKRLVHAGHTVHGLADVGTTPISELMRPAVFVDPHGTIRDAAKRLGDWTVVAVLVEMPRGEIGIVTDTDIRAGLVERELGLDDPVLEVARAPVPRVPAAQLAVEAAVDMLAVGADCVAVDDGGRICGVLAAADLVRLDARSPIALRHMLMNAADEDALKRAAERLPNLFTMLVAAGVPAAEIGRTLTLQHDAIVTRLLDFSIAEHGPPPVPWAWLDLGSAARREFTLSSDQDNALAYADPLDGERDGVDAYFAALGDDVNRGLAACGIGVDNNSVLAGSRLWRMSKSDWIRTFEECFTTPDESHLVRATVSFDFRTPVGGLTIVPELAERIRSARTHPQFMRLLARTAAGFPVALTRMGHLATERGGEGAGRVDVKKGGIVPIVNLVRFHAIASGVTISATYDRIEATASAGGLDRPAAEALAEAYEVITRIRLEHHAQRIDEGLAPDNLIDPEALPPIATVELRAALQTVRRMQKQISVLGGARM
jgi:CBS domain-containing protein